MALAIRGTGIQASSASSYTVPWPAGTVAGDLAVLFCVNGWDVNPPAGWTMYAHLTGIWNGAVFSRVLTASDITAGSVTVTFVSSFDGVVAIATISGATLPGISTTASQNNSGSSSISLGTPGSGGSDSIVFYFGSNRGASTDTVNLGTVLQQANDGANGSGCLFAESPGPSAASATFSYSSPGAANYQVCVVVANVAAQAYGGPLPSDASLVCVPAAAPQFSSGGPGSLPVPVATNLSGGVTGNPYSETISVQGGVAPYAFSIPAGSLPAGLSLNSSTGVISGMPTTPGTSTFTIRATDANGSTGDTPFEIIIAAPASGGGNYSYAA